MKILVIFTGGTIGSTVSDGYISTSSDAPYKLINMYRESAGKDARTVGREIEFISRQPFTLLSENLTGEYLAKLGTALTEEKDGDYDGIIVTHGSDTVQYSAAALSYLLPDISLPVLLVSSNKVLDDPAASGIPNFSAAVEFIYAKAGHGVFVPNQNSDGIVYIHRGSRVLSHMAYSDDIFSIGGQYYGFIDENGHYRENPDYRVSPEFSSKKHGLPLHMELPEKWNSEILWLMPTPGMKYPDLAAADSAAQDVKAVLLGTYHTGTLCSSTPGMHEFFAQAAELNVPVFLIGASSGPDYDSVKEWEDLNIDVLPPSSPVAAYIKLWMAMSSDTLLKEKSLHEIMHTPVGDDIIS